MLTHWSEGDSRHVIIGGDWNSSLAPRVGYAADSIIGGADHNLAQWIRDSGLSYQAPRAHTWTDCLRLAVLDAFVVREAISFAQPTSFESRDPRHDHWIILASLLDDLIEPMPELETLQTPVLL